MKNNLKGIFVCMLVILIALPSIGAMTIPTTWPMKKLIPSERYPTPSPTTADNLITIRIWAEVIAVNDSFNLLEGNIKIGDKITGKYTYDVETPDSLPDEPNIGLYQMNHTSCGVEIKAGSLVFKTDQDNPILLILIGNDIENQNSSFDTIQVISIADSLFSETMMCFVGLEFIDETATALSSIALPTKAPVLRKWENKTLYIQGIDPYTYQFFTVEAKVTLAIKSYGAGLVAVKSASGTPLSTIPRIGTNPVMQFWVRVFERFPNTFPILRHLMGY